MQAERGAQTGRSRQAQRVGAGQRVVQQRLHLGATQAQGCADHDGHQRHRQPEVPDDGDEAVGRIGVVKAQRREGRVHQDVDDFPEGQQ